jgi:hypothetical protein
MCPLYPVDSAGAGQDQLGLIAQSCAILRGDTSVSAEARRFARQGPSRHIR